LNSNNVARRIAEFFGDQFQVRRIIDNGFLVFKEPIPLYKNGG